MTLNRIVIGYYALLFIVFGVFGLFQPAAVSQLIHLQFSADIGLLDFVAMYGGLFLGVGFYLIYCLFDNLKSGLVCILFTMGFMLLARLYAFFQVGEADWVQYVYLAGELFTVLLTAALLFYGRSPGHGRDARALA